MKKIFFTIFIVFCFFQNYAAHIKGGFFTYEYLGPGINNPTFLRYKITLTIYSSPNPSIGPGPGTQIWDPINYTIFRGKNTTPFDLVSVNIKQQYLLSKLFASPCITGTNLTGPYYHIITYELNNYELPPSPDGYTISYQKCCRLNNMDNLTGSGSVGNTWSIDIPGTNAPIPNADHNSSPAFPINDTFLVCQNNYFTIPFGTTDPDGDSLSYSFCYAYEGGDQTNINPDPASAPPYSSVPYSPPYSGSQPLGALASINPVTGLISGIAPPIINTGEYVITVCIKEYKNGIYFADSRKELHIRVKDCSPLTASPNFSPITCDGFTVTFNENSSGNPTDFKWYFGDPASGTADTSTQQFPTHTFTDTGIFNIKLVVSISGQCIDSITKPMAVYPGFLPGFITSPILCANQPIQFTDTTYSAYGAVNSWRWDFGDNFSSTDISNLQHPVYTYSQPGTYTVELKVTNSKGCEKTIFKNIDVFAPPIVDVFPADTLYCGLDSLQLTGTGTGSFNWLPNTNIIGANTATPIVFPTVTTKYYAVLTSLQGCSSRDSITISPKFDLTNAFTGPSPICEEDTVTLTGTSNYAPNVSWQWSPTTTVESPTSAVTRVYPTVTTNYTLNTTWGRHCIVNTNKIITVKPLAIPNAGPSPVICGGQQSTQLIASGGNTYTWSPATGLSDPNIANPVASPTTTTIYTVAVGVTGCPKTRNDSLIVTVQPLPPLTVMNDTLICNIDTLQLTATGTGNYTWGPNYMISSTTAANPFISPDVPTKYFVTLTDGFGCQSHDTVFVDVKDRVTLFAGNDTTICRTDGFFLTTTGDALHYKWTPATYLNYDTVKRPFAKPLATTTYRVLANIGKCQSFDDVEITVVPYPAANAGADTILCPGFSVQLTASGGSSYLWSPATFLNNRNIADPVATRPTASIRYIVSVTDVLGCPKPVSDTVWVNVYPKTIANAGPRDTSVVIGEPLLLTATGGVKYLWDPGTWLNNAAIRTPTALPQDNIQYVVTATSAGGCLGTDTIMVHLFKIDPDMYVPTAFTPNGDGDNDIFKPILIGMKELRYFRVYNRFGNLVYSTTDIGKGWDGTYGGRGQDPATYVWMAEGVTFKGEVRLKKGYVVLIRQ